MPNVCYQLSHITFDIIYQILDFRITYPKQQCLLYLISPWFHDIDVHDIEHKFLCTTIFSKSKLKYDDIDKLSSIIKSIIHISNGVLNSEAGINKVEVILVTAKYNGTHISKSDPLMNRKEASLLRELLNFGVRIYFHQDLHAKMICTSGHTLSGSANVTYPGFFMHTEAVSLHYHGSEDYISDIHRARDIITEAQGFMNNDVEIEQYIRNHC